MAKLDSAAQKKAAENRKNREEIVQFFQQLPNVEPSVFFKKKISPDF